MLRNIISALFVLAILLTGGTPLLAQFSSATYSTGTGTAGILAVRDFNSDGAPDVVVAAGSSVVTLTGNLASGHPTGALTNARTSSFDPASVCSGAQQPGTWVNAAHPIENIAFGYEGTTTNPTFWLSLSGPLPTYTTNGQVVQGLIGHVTSSLGLPVSGSTLSCGNGVINNTPAYFNWVAVGDFNSDGTDDSVAVTGDNNIYFALGASSTYSPNTGSSGYYHDTPVSLPNSLTGATTVTAGDLNGDGLPDVVVGTSTGSVAYFLNQKMVPPELAYSGSPTFDASTIFTNKGSALIGAPVNRVLIADATGEGLADIVATTSSFVTILQNQGSGVFGSPIQVAMPAGCSASATAVADFNGDGFPDLAVVCSGNSSVVVFYRTGSLGGSTPFTQSWSTPLGSGPMDIVAVDMDRDGRPDLVVSGGGDGNVWVLLNTIPYLKITSSQGLQFLGVINGTASLVTPSSGYATVTIGTSSGSLPALSVVALPRSPAWVNLAITGSSNNQVTITPNMASAPGTGVFNGVAMVSGSGFRNVLIPYTINIARPSAGLVRGGVTGAAATGLPSGAADPQAYALGLFNGRDSNVEIASYTPYCPAYPFDVCDGIYTRASDGGSYSLPSTSAPVLLDGDVAGAAGGWGAVAADFNQDGKLDAAFAGSFLTIVFGDSASGLTSSRVYPVPTVSQGSNQIAAADLNGDGYPDLVVAASGSWGGSGEVALNPGVVVLLNDGAGGFSENVLSSPYTVGSTTYYKAYYSVAVADFNGDGIPDILARSFWNPNGSTGSCTGYLACSTGIDLFLGLGGGQFAAPQSVPAFVVPSTALLKYSNETCTGSTAQCSRPQAPVDPLTLSLVAADFNADGNMDFAYTDLPNNNLSPLLKPSMVVALGNGDGTFTYSYDYVPPIVGSSPAGLYPNNVVAADINGDGKMDLAVLRVGTGGYVAVLPGKGDGTFGPEADWGASGTGGFTFSNVQGGHSGILYFADLDGDGLADMIATNQIYGVSTSTPVSITMGAPGIAMSLDLSTATENTAQSFNVFVKYQDANHDPDTAYSGTVQFASSDTSAMIRQDSGTWCYIKYCGYTYTFWSGDAGTHNFSIKFSTLGSQTVTVTDTSNSSLTASVTITVLAAANQINFNPTPSSPKPVTAPFSVTAQVSDWNGNGAAGVNVTFSTATASGGANGTLTPSNGSVTTDANGNATITVTPNGSLGAFYVYAQVTSIIKTSAYIAITFGPATHFSVSGFGNPVPEGQSGSITVQVLDALNFPVTNYTGTVTFSTSSSQKTLPGNYHFLTSDSGVHTFTGVILNTPGTQSITVTDTANLSITGSQQGIQVQAPPPATHFSVTGYPSPSTAGTAYSITVTALDVNNNTATSYAGTVHFSSSDPKSSLPANYTFSSGTHTFTNGATLKTAGTQSISVFDVSDPTISGSQTGITVNPGAPAQLVPNVLSENIPVGGAANPGLSVTVEDANGNACPSANVTFAAPASGASGAFSGSATVQSSINSGVAAAPAFTANNVIGGPYNVTASVSSSSVSTTFTITNTFDPSKTQILSSTVTVTPSTFPFNHATNRYQGTITLKNVSGAAVSGPIEIVLNGLPSGVTMYQPSGTFNGVPFMSTAGLAIGQSVSVPVQLNDPSNAAISFQGLLYH